VNQETTNKTEKTEQIKAINEAVELLSLRLLLVVVIHPGAAPFEF